VVAVSGQLGGANPRLNGARPGSRPQRAREQVAVAVGRVGEPVHAQRERAVSSVRYSNVSWLARTVPLLKSAWCYLLRAACQM